MAAVLELRTAADLDQVLAASRQRPVLLFKHSTRCPISAMAYQEWLQFAGTPEAGRVNLAFVRVIESRPVSMALADRVGVAHESPQAILIRNGRGIWHRSHYDVTAAALKGAAAAGEVRR